MQPRVELEFAPLDLGDPTQLNAVHRLWAAAYAAELQWHRTWLQAWPDPALKQIDYPTLHSRLARLQADTAQMWGAWARQGSDPAAPGAPVLRAHLLGTLAIDNLDAVAVCTISSLHVDPVYHGQGVARALVGRLLQSTDERTICAHVPVGNAAARVALGRMGFLWHRQFNSTRSGLPMLELRWQRRQVNAHAPIQIRLLQPSEHQLHRAIRLRALRADPDAFAERYVQLVAESDDYWQQLTASVTLTKSGAMFIAEIGGRICGAVHATLTADVASSASKREQHATATATATVAGLWVDPSQRRRGAGRSLMACVFDWAHACGVDELRAWAPTHRDDAMGFAAALAFVRHDAAEPASSGAGAQLLPMRRAFLSDRTQAIELDR